MLAMLAVALGSLGAASAHTPRAPVTPAGPGPSVYVVSHGWHVGLVLRRQDLPASTVLARYAPGPFRYLALGWGDRDFYPAKARTLVLALRAAFRSGWAVLQVVGFDDAVTATFPRAKIVHVDVSSDGFASLARHIDATFALDPDGRPSIVALAEYGVGVFYRARGRYGLLDNSNTWVARGLKLAGCPIDVDAAVTAGAVLHQAARFGRVLHPGMFLHASNGSTIRCLLPDAHHEGPSHLTARQAARH